MGITSIYPKICAKCGKTLPDAARYCVRCGSDRIVKNNDALFQQSCPYCLSSLLITSTTTHCSSCGANLEKILGRAKVANRGLFLAITLCALVFIGFLVIALATSVHTQERQSPGVYIPTPKTIDKHGNGTNAIPQEERLRRTVGNAIGVDPANIEIVHEPHKNPAQP